MDEQNKELETEKESTELEAFSIRDLLSEIGWAGIIALLAGLGVWKIVDIFNGEPIKFSLPNLFCFIGILFLFVITLAVNYHLRNISDKIASEIKLNDARELMLYAEERERIKIDRDREVNIARDKLQYSDDLVEYLHKLITIEVGRRIQLIKKLNQEYNIMNLDNDIKEISNTVYEGINPDTYKKDKIIYTEDYFLKLIINITSVVMIEEITNYNASRRFE